MLLFNRRPFAEARPSGEVVQFGFQTQTLFTLMIFNATNGTFICQVNAVTVGGIISFPHQFEINVQVDVVGKLKVKSRNTYIYIYIHHHWPTLNKIIILHEYLTLCPFTLVSRLLSSPPMVAMVLQRLTAKRVHRKN